MDILEIIVLGLVPMLTILIAVVGFLMTDRKQLSSLISTWRERFQKQSMINKGLTLAHKKLKADHNAKLKKLKDSQGKQFQLGFSAFLENCQTEVRELLALNPQSTDDDLYRSALQVYAASLETTLGRFKAKGKVQYQDLMAPMKESVMDAVADSQSGSGNAIADSFQDTFKTQEADLVGLRTLIEQVYRGGQVVVKDEKDELVLVLEKQLRDRISQQREMLLQLHRLESDMGVDSAQASGSATPSDEQKWKGDMPKMMGS